VLPGPGARPGDRDRCPGSVPGLVASAMAWWANRRSAMGDGRRLVDGRADQRVTEREPCAELQQPRLGSGQQEQASGRLRERRDPPPEALPDPASQRHRADHAEPAGQFHRRYSVRQLEQGNGVAAGLGADAVANALIQAPGDDRGQQRPGVSTGQSLKHQSRKASGHPAGAAPRRAAPSPARHPPSGPPGNLAPLAGPDREARVPARDLTDANMPAPQAGFWQRQPAPA
jgi:hypothetical protein